MVITGYIIKSWHSGKNSPEEKNKVLWLEVWLLRNQAAKALSVATAMGIKLPINAFLIPCENMSGDTDGPQGNMPAPMR